MRTNRSLHPTLRDALVGLLLVAPLGARAQQTADVFDTFFRFGDTAHKLYAQQAPGETVDPFTGTLRIVQEDLSLPGKGGLDLRIVRTYSSKLWSRSDLLDVDPLVAENARSVLGYGWSFHMGRLVNPNAIAPTLGCGAGELPVFEGPDGESHVFYPVPSDASNRVYRSKDHWRLEMECAVLGGAGECVWSSDGIRYELSAAPDNPYWEGMRVVHPVTGIADANGNRISVAYLPGTGAVDHVVDSWGRTVSFTYTPGDDGLRLATMVANGNTFTYSYTPYTSSDTTVPGGMALRGSRRFLTEFAPPAGGVYRYEYGYAATVERNQYALTRMTSPFGGVTEYAYQSVPFFTGRDTVSFPVVSTVTRGAVSGRPGPTGVWTYSYASPPPNCALANLCATDPRTGLPTVMHVTTVTRPDGLRDTFELVGFGHIAEFNGARTLTYAAGLSVEVARADRAEVEAFGWTVDEARPISMIPYAAPVYGGNCGPYRVWDDGVWAPLLETRVMYRDSAMYVTEYSGWDAYGQAQAIVETGYQGVLNTGNRPEVQARAEIRTTARTFFSVEAESGATLNLLRGRPSSERVCIDGSCVDSAWTYNGPGHRRDSETRSGVTTTFGYDPAGNLELVTDAQGDTLRLGAYAWGVPTLITRTAAAKTVTMRRQPTWEGWIESETNGRSFTTTYAYDAIGRPLSVTPSQASPRGALPTLYDYTPGGIPDGQAVRVTRGTYSKDLTLDAYGREIATADSEGVRTEITYDVMGNVRFRSAPFGGPYASSAPVGESIEPDGLGRPLAVIRGYRPSQPAASCDADGVCAVSFLYHSNQTATTVERTSWDRVQTWRGATSYGDPSEARLTAVTDGLGRLWRYAYTAAGKLSGVDAPLPQGNRSFTYDDHQFLRTETTAETGRVTFVPNAIGQVTSRTDARGVVARYGYEDPFRLPTSVSWGTDDDVLRTYDEAGNGKHVETGSAGALDLEWDALNRPLGATWTFRGATYRTTYDFDAAGCLRTMTYPTGTTLTMTCDGLNRVRSIALQRPGEGSAPVVTEVGYHPSGQAAQYVFGNGITTRVTYDDHARVSALDATRPNAEKVAGLSYRYDGAGNVVFYDNSAEPNAARTMAYDAADRLTAVVAWGQWGYTTYDYDELGNLTGKHRSAGDRVFVYDPETNRIAYSTGSAPAPVGLTWDAPGRLAASSDQATYVYDAGGRRVQKSDPSGTVVYHYDAAGRLIAETQPDGAKLRDYVYLGNKLVAVDGCVTVSPPSPCTERQWYHTDALGSVVARTDEGGNTVAQFDYEGFGERWNAPGLIAGVDGDRQYNGRVYDAGTGFHDYGARLYWPEIGRFVSADTYLGDPGNPASLNRYSYVHNNPYKYVDPDGHQAAPANRLARPPSQVDWAARGRVVREAIAEGRIEARGQAHDTMGPAGEPPPEAAVRQAERIADAVDPPQQIINPATGLPVGMAGIYEFPDATAGGVPYVGQSGNIPRRLAQHEAAGRLGGPPAARSVQGGKTAREIAEHNRIQEITGGVPARQSPNVSNKVDPIGPNRQHLLKNGSGG